jgi:pimeloyl-ACP methyl ester carboxylesterase
MSQHQAVLDRPPNVDQRGGPAAGLRGQLLKRVPVQALSCAIVPHVKRTMRQLIKIGTKQVPDTELRRIEVPTALLWGRYDRFVPLRLAEGASARLGWPLHVIDDAGHVPHLEQPHAFLSALHSALASSHSH